MEFKDYYKVMELERDATQDQIKRAYKRLARKFHPDVSKAENAEARFKEVGEAYAVLKDVEKRAAYDRLGANWKAEQGFQPPPDWDSGFEFSGNGADGSGNGHDFSEFFESLFGGAQAGRHARTAGAHARARSADHHAKVMIDLEDAYTGATRTITLQAPEVDAQGHVALRSRTLAVNIPRGVHAGQHLRLAGQGAAAPGSERGDLYLEIQFQPHPLYRVDQSDVYVDLPASPWEMALGATVEVPTPGGAVQLAIPAGSMAGRKLRLKGRGIPGRTPGDFFAVLGIALPQADSDAAKQAYEQMAAQFGSFNPRAGMGV